MCYLQNMFNFVCNYKATPPKKTIFIYSDTYMLPLNHYYCFDIMFYLLLYVYKHFVQESLCLASG
jgi:hypothetical protein